MKALLFASLLCASSASRVTRRLPQLCCGWDDSAITSLKNGTRLQFSFAVKETNMDLIRETVAAVSDPRSQRYGEYLSTDELDLMTKPLAADLSTVTDWLGANDINFRVSDGGRMVNVDCSAAQAEALLRTSVRTLTNHETKQTAIKAIGEYTLPTAVHQVVTGLFGLHDLPLPSRPKSQLPGNPASVTPAVLASTYSIAGIKPTGSLKNTMAVAEFQGQYMKPADLVSFFSKYVPHAQKGDDEVSKFVGSPNKPEGQVEASLDIQYIMGVAPHIKTEFWLFTPMAFCSDLKNWTTTILSDAHAPLVHSVSYGWQGELKQLQCTVDLVNSIDADFAKLAAKGITIIFASGDSGSAYSPPHVDCEKEFKNDTALVGLVEEAVPSNDPMQCCDDSEGSPWMWSPPEHTPFPTCENGNNGAEGKIYTGDVLYDLRYPNEHGAQSCCQEARETRESYFSWVPGTGDEPGFCTIFLSVNGTKPQKGALFGQPGPAVEGVCTTFQKVTGSKAQAGVVSNTPGKMHINLYPSWPASSPYITAVGSTRFVKQQVGQPEMATDQFGSGGGFSTMFAQSPNAKWQTEAVAHYTSAPPKDVHYPPAGSFPITGRATPDISALGEGYQVFVNGHVEVVGGTSASTPAFAGMVALLNEARIQHGKPAMGFLNPFLYQNADAFTDVTLGTNAISRGGSVLKYGFKATKGWDPATGLGTPRFDKLLAAALK